MPMTTSLATERRGGHASSIAGSMIAGSPTILILQRLNCSRIASVPPRRTESTSTVWRRAVSHRGLDDPSGLRRLQVVVDMLGPAA